MKKLVSEYNFKKGHVYITESFITQQRLYHKFKIIETDKYYFKYKYFGAHEIYQVKKDNYDRVYTDLCWDFKFGK